MNFNVIIVRLAKIPPSQRYAIYAVLYVVLIALYISVGYLPVSNNISTLKASQVELRAQLAQIQTQVDQREAYRDRLKALMDDLKIALKELPEDREIPGLLKSISSLGKKVGLEVLRFQPLPEKMRQYVAEVPVALEVEGSYHEVAMFFDRLSKMNRIVYVEDINMSTPEERGGKIHLRVTGNAVTFRFLSDEEIAEIRSKAESKGKQGRR
ncbi:MAG: type IV pilus assembly protein PilO [Myxococcota bacterium]